MRYPKLTKGSFFEGPSKKEISSISPSTRTNKFRDESINDKFLDNEKSGIPTIKSRYNSIDTRVEKPLKQTNNILRDYVVKIARAANIPVGTEIESLETSFLIESPFTFPYELETVGDSDLWLDNIISTSSNPALKDGIPFSAISAGGISNPIPLDIRPISANDQQVEAFLMLSKDTYFRGDAIPIIAGAIPKDGETREIYIRAYITTDKRYLIGESLKEIITNKQSIQINDVIRSDILNIGESIIELYVYNNEDIIIASTFVTINILERNLDENIINKPSKGGPSSSLLSRYSTDYTKATNRLKTLIPGSIDTKYLIYQQDTVNKIENRFFEKGTYPAGSNGYGNHILVSNTIVASTAIENWFASRLGLGSGLAFIYHVPYNGISVPPNGLLYANPAFIAPTIRGAHSIALYGFNDVPYLYYGTMQLKDNTTYRIDIDAYAATNFNPTYNNLVISVIAFEEDKTTIKYGYNPLTKKWERSGYFAIGSTGCNIQVTPDIETHSLEFNTSDYPDEPPSYFGISIQVPPIVLGVPGPFIVVDNASIGEKLTFSVVGRKPNTHDGNLLLSAYDLGVVAKKDMAPNLSVSIPYITDSSSLGESIGTNSKFSLENDAMIEPIDTTSPEVLIKTGLFSDKEEIIEVTTSSHFPLLDSSITKVIRSNSTEISQLEVRIPYANMDIAFYVSGKDEGELSSSSPVTIYKATTDWRGYATFFGTFTAEKDDYITIITYPFNLVKDVILSEKLNA
jgi:hypothetical protein